MTRSAKELGRLSLECVSAGDKQRWLRLFEDEAVVHDPYGRSEFDPDGEGHRGSAAIEAFWELAIAGNRISGTIHHSFEAGDSCANVMTTRTERPDGEVLELSNVTVYRASSRGRLLSLTAYWNFDQLGHPPTWPHDAGR